MIVYSKFSPFRKDEFRIYTTIAKDGDVLSVRKQAENDSAKIFLDKLIESYSILKKQKAPLIVIEPRPNDNYIEFDYIDGQSLDTLLYKAVKSKDRANIEGVFVEYRKIIEQIKTIKTDCHSKEFVDVFGEKSVGVYDCLDYGCYDLTLENIFKNKANGKYYLIDYEWTFGFPIPKKLVLIRTLFNSIAKYRIDGIHSMIALEEMLSIFRLKSSDIDKYLEMEWAFQNKFTLLDMPLGEFINEKLAPISMGETLSEERDRLGEEVICLQDKNHAIRQEFDIVVNSRFWKMRNIIAGIFGKKVVR